MGGLDASALITARRVLHRPPSQTLPHEGKGFSSAILTKCVSDSLALNGEQKRANNTRYRASNFFAASSAQ
jgi:hypothetical protein